MKNILQSKVLEVDKQNVLPFWTVKQNDDIVVNLELYKNAQPLSLKGQTIGILAICGTEKIESVVDIGDGGINQPGEVLNTLQFELKITTYGQAKVELNLVDLDGSMTTAYFLINVERGIGWDYTGGIPTDPSEEPSIDPPIGGGSSSSLDEAALANISKIPSIIENIGNMELLETSATNLVAAINEVFLYVSSGKELLANALIAKGIPTLATDSFETIANNIGLIEGGTLDVDSIVTEEGEFLVGYDIVSGGGGIEPPAVEEVNYINVTLDPTSMSSLTTHTSTSEDSMTVTSQAYNTRHVCYVVTVPANDTYVLSYNYDVVSGGCNCRVWAGSTMLAQTGFTNGATGSGTHTLEFSNGDSTELTIYFYVTDNSSAGVQGNVTFSNVQLKKKVIE